MTVTPKRACDWKAGVTMVERAVLLNAKPKRYKYRGGYVKKPFSIVSPDGIIYKGDCLSRWLSDNLDLFATLKLPKESRKHFETRVYRKLLPVIGPTHYGDGQWNGWTLAGNRPPIKIFIVRRKKKFVQSFPTRETAQEFIDSRSETGYTISSYKKLL